MRGVAQCLLDPDPLNIFMSRIYSCWRRPRAPAAVVGFSGVVWLRLLGIAHAHVVDDVVGPRPLDGHLVLNTFY